MARTLVVGLARSGIAAGRLLAARGEDVLGVDAGAPALDDPGFPVLLGADGLAQLDGVELVVKSPGVPPRAPVVAAARERGIPVIGELELAWRALHAEHRFLAVTGTNGKTTVTAWIADAFARAGVPAVAAGNVGTALASLVGTLPPGTTVVCECSSYQLFDTVDFRPDLGVLLHVGSDHLDWHGSVEAYRDAKTTGMFARQTPEDVAIVPAGVEVPGAGARRVWEDEPVGEVGLAGAHNRANAQAVAAACRAAGLPEDAIAASLASFGGVEHRLELVDTIDGVRYVNDSKATNVASLATALAAFAGERVHLIAGGDDAKREPFAPLAGALPADVHLIGAAAERIRGEWGRGDLDGDLPTAFARAAAAAAPGDVVLLAPGCASFDQYPNFEERGRSFKELVRARRTQA